MVITITSQPTLLTQVRKAKVKQQDNQRASLLSAYLFRSIRIEKRLCLFQILSPLHTGDVRDLQRISRLHQHII